MSLSCHSPSWQWLPECCWQQTRQIRSDGAGSGSERFVFKIGMPGRLPCLVFRSEGAPHFVVQREIKYKMTTVITQANEC